MNISGSPSRPGLSPSTPESLHTAVPPPSPNTDPLLAKINSLEGVVASLVTIVQGQVTAAPAPPAPAPLAVATTSSAGGAAPRAPASGGSKRKATD